MLTDFDAIRAKIAGAEERLKLERALRAARFRIAPEHRGKFERARFDFAGRRLVGDGWALVAGDGRYTVLELSPC